MNRFLRGISLYLLIAIIAISIVSSLYPGMETRRDLGYGDFINQVVSGSVESAEMIGDQRIEGVLKDGSRFATIVPMGKMPDLADLMMDHNVRLKAEPTPPPPWWLSLLPNIITLVIFVGIWMFILNQMQGGNNRAMSFGKSRAKMHTEDKIKVRFADVAALDEAKQELVEVVEFLKHPKKFQEVGAKVPKGVLLMGPPGNGKTLLARAVAGEAGVPFFSISGSDFVEMFVGVGASRVRDLFDTAKKNAPCIIFVDELDAVGRHRGAGLGGGHDEREQTLNQLLVEMDGFEPNSGIIVMAATNRPDVLDPALLRPGRFDRKIVVDRPDVIGREEVLKVHSRGKPLDDSVDLKVLARRTPGFSGADLENLMNEAAILTARANRRKVLMEDCEEAIDRLIMGPERKRRVLTQRDKRVFAYHEAGHAVVANYLLHSDPVHKVSIIGRGMAGGYTMTLPTEDRYVVTRSELVDELVHLLGGRAAEELAFDEISTGAQNDLERATKRARQMVTEWGMSEELGPLTFGRQHEEQIFLGRDISRERNYSEEVAAAIDREVRRFVEEAYERAKDILSAHEHKLEEVVQGLLEHETLDRDDFRKIMGDEYRPYAVDDDRIAESRPSKDEAQDHKHVAAVHASDEQSSQSSNTRGDGSFDRKQPKPAVTLE
ncbi:MAG: ATP-dependent zinc metalloprotease FtsH [Firmicutes bacterium]|nr:ATP-dependent zinc metalloprotease FtsH [Bacillota bacterium]